MIGASRRRWLLVGVAIAAAIAVWPAGGGAQTRRTENVVLVTLDGARWQEIFTGMDELLLQVSKPREDYKRLPVYREFSGATPTERREKLMPFLWRTLVADHGFIAGDRTAGSIVSVTNRMWFSYPGYSEILTGQAHDAEIDSNDPIRNPFPSVFQFLVRRVPLSPPQVATFASWGTFSAIVESEVDATTVNAGPQRYEAPGADLQLLNALQQETPMGWENTRRDAYTFRFAMDYLKRAKPRVLYIAFDETDDWAHDGHYDLVLTMLHRTDAYLRELWTALQADPQYRGKTTLIVTTDHGRGKTATDWGRHGKDVAGADEIWLAIASPDSQRRGLWRDGPPLYQNQIAATIASLFGLSYREQNPSAGAPIELR